MKQVKILAFVMAFVLAFSVASARAQKEAGLKIGYVDISRLFESYGKTKEYNKILEDKFSAYEADRNKRIEKIKGQEGKLAALKEDERNKLMAQLDNDKQSFQEYDRQQQIDFKREYDDRMKEILTEIEKVIKDFAQKENYAIILNNKVLAYGSDALDVTAQIIKLLNPQASPAKK